MLLKEYLLVLFIKKHDLNPRHNLEVNTYFGKIEKLQMLGRKGKSGKDGRAITELLRRWRVAG